LGGLDDLIYKINSVSSLGVFQRPVRHCWSGLTKEYKKKFCNVCRKRLDDIPSRYCESKLKFSIQMRDTRLQ